MIPELVFGILLAVIHYLSGFFSARLEGWHAQLLSFSSGVSIAILFNELLPIAVFSLASFEGVLLGFLIFHVFENFLYQHYPQKQKERGIMVADILAFTINNLVRGLLVAFAFKLSSAIGVFTALTIVLHTISSSFMFEHLLENFKSVRRLKVMFSIAPLIGVLIALVLATIDKFFFTIFALSVGALLYVVVRDMMPHAGAKHLPYFILGALLAFIFSSFA